MSDEEQEIWKSFSDYPSLEVSNLGRVRTKDRIVMRKDGTKYPVNGRILKQCFDRHGYLYVCPSVNGKRVHLYLHRMAATCFIPNSNNLPEVNHKDNNPTNNIVSNLEWCTHEQNMAYKEKFGVSSAEALGRPVVAVNLDTFEVFWFESQREAERKLGVTNQCINGVVKGRRKKTCGHWFCRADEKAIEKVRVRFGDKIADKVKKLIW